MLNYTTGKQKDGNINYFILLDSVKKQIFAAIEETASQIGFLLSNFNIFKAFMIQKLVYKEMKIKKKKISDKRRLDILLYMVANEDFFKEIVEKYSEQCKSPLKKGNEMTKEDSELSK